MIAIVQRKHVTSFVRRQTMMVKIPATINDIPPKNWLFFHVVSFFILHFVRKPIREFIRNFGITFPVMIIIIPKTPKST